VTTGGRAIWPVKGPEGGAGIRRGTRWVGVSVQWTATPRLVLLGRP
jgi:hypothetical protein